MNIDQNCEVLISELASDAFSLADFLSERIVMTMSKSDRCSRVFEVVAKFSDSTVAAENLFKDSACKAGCSHCCRLYVETTKSEAKAIAGYMKRFDKYGRQVIIDKIKENAALEKLGFDAYSSINPTCAFVDPENGYCQVYEARPIACRLFDGHSADECRDQMEVENGTTHRTPALIYLGQLLMNVCSLLHMKFGLSSQKHPLHTNVLKEINALKRK